MEMQPLLRLMDEVGRKLVDWQKTSDMHKVGYKAGQGIVSELDRRAEKELRKGIEDLLPDYKIWGEELGRDEGDLGVGSWVVIDPIDGSKNYLAGNPLFASQLAGIVDGEMAWGIINLPALGEMYWVVKGQGAWCNEEKITPSTQKDLGLALQCFGIGHDAGNFVRLPLFIKDKLAEPRHYGCAGVHFAFMANGRTDIYIAEEAALYDMAAGLLLCQEAGLPMATLAGDSFEFGEKNTSVVIGNKRLLDQFKALLG